MFAEISVFYKVKVDKFCCLKIWRGRMVDERLSALGHFIFVEGVLIFAFVMLLHLDWIVHNMLYRYNLVFSLDWAVPYLTALRIVAGLLITAIASIAVMGFLAFRRARREAEKVVYICKNCGNAWVELDRNVKVGAKLPKFRILRSCATCDRKILED